MNVASALPWWSWSLDGWIVVVAALAAAACAIPGSFLVLRRMSMMGDAISHAVLPGIAAAFLLTDSRASVPMFLGAAIVGVLTALGSDWLRSRGRIDADASIGIVFTTLFAIGLVMIVRGASRVDLDPGCVLYGAIETTPLDLVAISGFEVPRAALVLGTVLVANALCVVVFWKELTIASFDADAAASQGCRPALMHMLLMTMTAVTAVAAFESVGSILVVALLVVPAATARLFTSRVGTMVVAASLVGAASGALGHIAAVRIPAAFGLGSVNSAGMIAVVSGAVLVVTILVVNATQRWRRRGVDPGSLEAVRAHAA